MTPAERDLYIRTIIGEAGNQPAQGQAAVAHVIQNRLNSGKWGGSYNSVILAPKQFSLWNPGDPAGIMAKGVSEDSPQYQRVAQIVDDVTSGKTPDPTSGALNYYNPKAASPAWGATMANAVDIGAHRFGTAGTGATPSTVARIDVGPVDAAQSRLQAAGQKLAGVSTTPVTDAPPMPQQSDNGMAMALAMLARSGNAAPQEVERPTPQLPMAMFEIGQSQQAAAPPPVQAAPSAPRPMAAQPLQAQPFGLAALLGGATQIPGRPAGRLT